jgi:hypothetical protein
MHEFLTVASGLLAISGGIPYIIDTIKGKTRPNIVTWGTWSLLNGINTAAAFSHGDLQTAFFSGCGTLITGAIAILGFRQGVRKYTRFDAICQLVALLGIPLWLLTDNPALAVAIVIAVDFAGGLPTLRHAWRAPHEETFATFLVSGIAGLLLIASLRDFNFVALGMPLYIFLFDISVIFAILYRTQRKPKGDAV